MSLFNHNFQWRSRRVRAKNTGAYTASGKPGEGQAVPQTRTLAEAPVGKRVRVTGFDRSISSQRWAHLQSYGLIPGSYVLVQQHSPVTIVQIEHLELALETDLARLVNISL